MKELFRDREFVRVGYFQSILESEGIPTHIRNQNLSASGLAEIPIPDFYPALCVVNDEDYSRAMELLRRRAKENERNVDRERKCPNCPETSPGNFDVCWSCGSDL